MKTDTKIVLSVLGLCTAIILFIIFTAPKPTPLDVTLINEGKNFLGKAEATNTLVEFSDFFCPACKTADPFVTAVAKKYADKMRFIYRHFPLGQHPLAFKAALGAEAAGKQGKFWEYKDKLFAKQESLVELDFLQIATDLSLDMNKFAADLTSNEILKDVQTDLATAQKLNLSSTPTFFLNGQKLSFDSFENLDKAIEAKLQ